MTEQEWLTSADPEPMLAFLRTRATGRKLRLFAVGCCRRVWPLLDEWSRRAVEVAEALAEGVDDRATVAERGAREAVLELQQQSDALFEAAPVVSEGRLGPARRPGRFGGTVKEVGVDYLTLDARIEAAHAAVFCVAEDFDGGRGAATLARAAAASTQNIGASGVADREVSFRQWAESREPLLREEAREQADLLRHIIGPMFRPSAPPLAWPAGIVALAGALYEGEACHYALHDALLDAGQPELADHFKESFHPKGCFALDLILGKK